MSKRVYEIAREKSLDSKEVIKRLREAGVEENHPSATIEDPVYERVFGDGQNGQPNAEATPTEPAGATVEDAQNGRPEASAVSTPGAPVEQQEPVTEARRSGRKRRRVVIDASATNRGASRTAATPAAAREQPKAAPVEEHVGETANKTAVRIEPGATVKDLADALDRRDRARRRRNGGRGRARGHRRACSGRGIAGGCSRGPRREATGSHGDGPRRPRQDLTFGPNQAGKRSVWRGRGHHAAHRRLPGRERGQEDYLHRHSGPRGVYRDAGPRC